MSSSAGRRAKSASRGEAANRRPPASPARGRQAAAGERTASAVAARERAVFEREQGVASRESALAAEKEALRVRDAAAHSSAEAERLLDLIREANQRLVVSAVDSRNASDDAAHEAAQARADLRRLMIRLRDANQRLMAAARHAHAMTEKARRREEEYRQLSNRLLRVQDEERRRLARDLHDSTAQHLAALTMNLDLVEDATHALDRRSALAIAESRSLAERCAREVRTLAYLLHPPLLDELGLLSALNWFVQGFSQRSGIRVRLDLAAIGRLPEAVETALFRIVQESLSNIHRHAGSLTASISLTRTTEMVALHVRDQGHGPGDGTQRAKPDSGPGTLGVGIAGMRERIAQLGGTFDITFTDRGTTVLARVPLPRSGE